MYFIQLMRDNFVSILAEKNMYAFQKWLISDFRPLLAHLPNKRGTFFFTNT
jgi:hypothetical protein